MTFSSPAVGADASDSESPKVLGSQTGANDPVVSWRRSALLEWTTVLAACASPLLLLLGARDWLLTPISDIDAWQYVALFDHYTNPDYVAGHYKLARLPWILSGWLVHRVASGVTAAYWLHAMFLIAAGCGFFVLLRALFGRFRLALLGAMLLVFHSPFHGSGGWDYHNTAAGTFYLWTLATVTLTAMKGGARRALLAGVMAALAVHSNITYGVFLPVVAVHYLFVYRSSAHRFPTLRLISKTTMWGTIGALGVTALLSAVNVMIGREALFFAALLDITLRYTRDPRLMAGWWHPWSSGWFWARPHLALPTALALLSPALLWASRHSTPVAGLRERLVTIEFLVMAAIWTAWQSVGNHLLEWDYFTYPLQPHVLLALMALANARLMTIPVWALVATPLLLLLPLSLGLTLLPTALAGRLLGPAACFLVAGVAMWMPSAVRTLAFVGLFAIGNTMLFSSVAQSYSARGSCHNGAAAYTAIVSANLFVSEADPALTRTRLWFDETETTTSGCPLTSRNVGYSLAGTGIPYVMNPFPMPSLTQIPDDVLRRTAGDNLAIVSLAPGTVRQFEQRALVSGLEAIPIASRRFSVQDEGFDVTLLRLHQSSEQAHRIAQLPGGTIADWSREKLRTVLESNTYALPRRDILQRGPAGELIFSPATLEDHLATPFVPVPEAVDARALLIAAAPDATRDVNCRMFVQDERLRVLSAAPCGELSLAAEGTVVPVSADVKAVRIFFQSETKKTMMLPNRLRISYHHGPTVR